MSNRDPDPLNLTGVWQGLYTYPGINKSVSFVATLIETPGTLTGSTHEPCVFRDGAGGTLFATLVGGRGGAQVAFRKTYAAAGPNYDLVDYQGTLSADGIDPRNRQGGGTHPQGSRARVGGPGDGPTVRGAVN